MGMALRLRQQVSGMTTWVESIHGERYLSPSAKEGSVLLSSFPRTYLPG